MDWSHPNCSDFNFGPWHHQTWLENSPWNQDRMVSPSDVNVASQKSHENYSLISTIYTTETIGYMYFHRINICIFKTIFQCLIYTIEFRHISIRQLNAIDWRPHPAWVSHVHARLKRRFTRHVWSLTTQRSPELPPGKRTQLWKITFF